MVPVEAAELAAWVALVVAAVKAQVPDWVLEHLTQREAAHRFKTSNGLKNKPSNKLNPKFAARNNFLTRHVTSCSCKSSN